MFCQSNSNDVFNFFFLTCCDKSLFHQQNFYANENLGVDQIKIVQLQVAAMMVTDQFMVM